MRIFSWNVNGVRAIEKKGFLEKARGGPILSGVDQYLMNRYR